MNRSHKLLLFENFTNDKIPALIADLESEISSSKMRVGPSMDKLPWAMEVAVFDYLKDRIMEVNSTSNQVDIDTIVSQLEDHQQEVKDLAIHSLVDAGMGEDTTDKTYDIGYRVVKLKNYNLMSRPIQGKRDIQQDLSDNKSGADDLANPNESKLDQEFRSSRNRGRNIMRKHLAPKPEPTPEVHHQRDRITPKSISVHPAQHAPSADFN